MTADTYETVTPETDAPGISGPASIPEGAAFDAPVTDAFNMNRRRTALHEVANEIWGYNWLSDGPFHSLIKYVDPDTADNYRQGFSVKLATGGKMFWQPGDQNNPHESITCSKRHFCPEAAASMIAMARLRGWKTLTLTGTPEHKEILWLEAMRQELQDRDTYLQQKRDGSLPVGPDGKPEAYQPLRVEGFTPLADSPVYLQWLQEEAAWRDMHPDLDGEPVAVTPASDPAPAEKTPEPETPAAETTAPAEKSAEKKSGQKKTTAPKPKNPGSKFMSDKKGPQSKFMTGPCPAKKTAKPVIKVKQTYRTRNNPKPH